MINPILIEDNFNQEPQRHGELKPPLQYFPVEIIDDPDEINPDFIIYEVTNGITKTFLWYEVHEIPSPRLPAEASAQAGKRGPQGEPGKLRHVFPDLQSSQNFVESKLKELNKPNELKKL